MVEKYTPNANDLKKQIKINPEDKLRERENLIFLGELVYKSFSWPYITKKMCEKLELDITETQVKKIFEEYKAKRSELLTEDEELKQNIVNTIIDVDDQLTRINNVTNTLLDNLIAEGYEDKDMVLKTIREIRGQIDLQTNLVKKLTDGFDEHKINEQKYIKMSLDNLQELEKNHFIRILRKPGEIFDPNALETISITKKQLDLLTKERKLVIPGGIVINLLIG